MRIEKASKKKTKLRLAEFGPSGAGKTYTALLLAKGMLESDLIPDDSRIVVIDSEHRSAEKYADRFEFDVLDLKEPTVDNMIAALDMCREYPICIVDSFSHTWRELLEEVDKLANTKYKGNKHSAWSEGTPKQKKLVKAILTFPGHLIVTMRSKTEWIVESSGGKSKPVRVGLAPEQGKGIEYEFDMLFELSPEHNGHVLKDRTGKFQDRIIEKPGESFGLEIIEWLNEGADVVDPFKQMVEEKKLGENAKGLLLLYLNHVQDEATKKLGKKVSHQAIKDGAVKSPEKFWSGFDAYLNKYKKEDTSDDNTTSADDKRDAGDGTPPSSGEGMVGQAEDDAGDPNADCF